MNEPVTQISSHCQQHPECVWSSNPDLCKQGPTPPPTPVHQNEGCCMNNTAWVTGTGGNWLVIDCATDPAVNAPWDTTFQKCQSYPQCYYDPGCGGEPTAAPTRSPTAPPTGDFEGCCAPDPNVLNTFYPCFTVFPTINTVVRDKTCDSHSQCAWTYSLALCNGLEPTPVPTPVVDEACCVENPAGPHWSTVSPYMPCSHPNYDFADKCTIENSNSACMWDLDCGGDCCLENPNTWVSHPCSSDPVTGPNELACNHNPECYWNAECNTPVPTMEPTPAAPGTCCVNNPAYAAAGGVFGASGVPACTSATMQWVTKCEPGSALPGPVSQCMWASGDWCTPTPAPTPFAGADACCLHDLTGWVSHNCDSDPITMNDPMRCNAHHECAWSAHPDCNDHPTPVPPRSPAAKAAASTTRPPRTGPLSRRSRTARS